MLNKRKIVQGLVILVVIIIVLMIILDTKNKNNYSNNQNKNSQTNQSNKLEFEKKQNEKKSKLAQIIKRKFPNKNEKIAVSIRVLEGASIENEGFSFDYNENELFQTKTAMKIPIAMYLYDKANKEEININDTISISKEKDKTQIKLENAIEEMVVSSNNVETDMIIRGYFKDNTKLYKELTNYFHNMDYEQSQTSNEQKIMELQYLYDNKKAFKKLYELLEEISNKDQIQKYVIDKASVAGKTEIGNGEIQNMSIVQSARSTYLIVISGEELKDAAEKMAQMSEEIFYTINEAYI